LGEYASYDMTFHIPKGMKIAATGARLKDYNEGNENVSVWKSEGPQTVAGFNFGKFKVEEAKLTSPAVSIESYANEETPDWVQGLQQATSNPLPSQRQTLDSGFALGLDEHYRAQQKGSCRGRTRDTPIYRILRSVAFHPPPDYAANGLQLRPVVA